MKLQSTVTILHCSPVFEEHTSLVSSAVEHWQPLQVRDAAWCRLLSTRHIRWQIWQRCGVVTLEQDASDDLQFSQQLLSSGPDVGVRFENSNTNTDPVPSHVGFMRSEHALVSHEVGNGAARDHAYHERRELSGSERKGYQALVLIPDGSEDFVEMCLAIQGVCSGSKGWRWRAAAGKAFRGVISKGG